MISLADPLRRTADETSVNAAPSGRVLARIRLGQPDIDILLLCVADQFFEALLASDPRLLVAAKRGSGKMAPDLWIDPRPPLGRYAPWIGSH